MRGCVWLGESFLRNDKWEIKLSSDFFPIHIQLFINETMLRALPYSKSTRMLPSGRVLGTKVQKGHKGALFLGEHHYTESKLSLLSIMTQTQEIITHVGFGKFTNGNKGMCMSGGNFLKQWQVIDQIIEWIFMQFIFNLLQMTQTQEIITCRVSKTQEWIQKVCVWVRERYLINDKWQIKLLSDFFYNSYLTFYKWLKLKK